MLAYFLAVDPDFYSVQLVALILLGMFLGGAVCAALIVGPLCHARGKRAVLRTIRRGTVKVSDCLP